MSNIEKINYKDNDIFSIVHKGSEDEMIAAQEKLVNMVRNTGREDILMLIDMTDAVITPKYHQRMKKLGKETTPIINKAAVVGMSTGIKSVIINGFIKFSGMKMKLFNSIEKAKEWLVEN